MKQLIKKLQIKDGQKGKLLNVPADFQKIIAAWPRDLLTTSSKELDYVLVFVTDTSDIAKNAVKVVKQVREDGLIWFVYPKKSSAVETDISRDSGWEPLTKLGYRPVRMVSVDDVWSGFRFREKSKVNRNENWRRASANHSLSISLKSK